MILDVCDNPTVLEVMRIIKMILLIIRIVVPLILIISLMVGYTRAVANKDSDALANANKVAVKKAIAAILVFLIPTFVNIIANMTISSDTYISCLNLATTEGINASKTNLSYQYINKAKESLSKADYNAAYTYINGLSDENTKKTLLNELQSIKSYVDLSTEIDSLKQNYDANKYNNILNIINSISDNTYKQKLLNKLKEVTTTTYPTTPTGEPLNLESSFKQYSDNTYPIFKGYYLYIPKNATTNMPLVVVFPPNSLSGPSMVKILETKSLDNFPAFIYVPLLASSERKDWNQSASTYAVKKIQDLVKQYNLNASKISLTAFSSSGWYIYWTANEYRIFSAIAPISSGMGIDTIKNYYKDWEYLKTLPMKGYGEKGGATTASGRSCAGMTVNWSAKSAMCSTFEGLGKCSNCLQCDAFTYMSESCHGEMGNHVFAIDQNNNNISDILEWMISQTK